MDGITVLSILVFLIMIGIVVILGVPALLDPLTKVDMGCIAPLVLLLIISIYLFIKLRKSSQTWERIAAHCFLGLEILVLPSYVAIGVYSNSARAPKLDVISTVRESKICSGKSIPNTRSYSPDAQLFHPLVIVGHVWVSPTSRPSFDNNMEWVPNHIEDLELVACAETEVITVDSCKYSAITIPAYQKILTINIYIAATGILVEKRVIQGGLPPKCPETVRMNMDTGKADPPYLIGDTPPFPYDWLTQLFEKPNR